MPGSMTDYAENLALNLLVRGATLAQALTPHVGLLTAAPTDLGGGTEVAVSGYARKPIAAAMANAANGAISNASAINFGAFTADVASPIVAIAVWDALSNGNMLFYDVIAPHIVKAGDPNQVPAGALNLKAGGNLSVAGANWLLNILCGKAAQVSAITPYLALYNVLPNGNDAGGTEVSATGYSRKACGSTIFGSDAAYGQVISSAAVDFGTFSTDANDITGAAIRSALTSGTNYLFVPIPVRQFKAGDPCIFPAGSIVLSGD